MYREDTRRGTPGMLALLLFIGVGLVATWRVIEAARAQSPISSSLWAMLLALAILGLSGLFTVQPNDGKVLTLFGKYSGTVREQGLWWANPFLVKKRISLRVRNFETAKLKVNDSHSNPIEIGAVAVHW